MELSRENHTPIPSYPRDLLDLSLHLCGIVTPIIYFPAVKNWCITTFTRVQRFLEYIEAFKFIIIKVYFLHENQLLDVPVFWHSSQKTGK